MGPALRNMGELAPEILPSAEGRTRPDVGRWEVPPPGLRPPPRTAEFRDARPHITRAGPIFTYRQQLTCII